MFAYKKVIQLGIAALIAAMAPLAANATIVEATWQVKLTEAWGNDGPTEITRPTDFQYKVRFSTDVDAIYDDPAPTDVFFDPSQITVTRPPASYLPERPEGGTRTAYGNVFTTTMDENGRFREVLTITQHEFIDASDIYWRHSTWLYTSIESEGRGGDGDYPLVGDDFIAFLTASMTDPEGYSFRYRELAEIREDGEFGNVLSSVIWYGEMQLTDLQFFDETEVPEPPLMALFGTGLLGLALSGRRQRHLPKAAC